MVNGNKGAFMATVDKAEPVFFHAQQIMFENLEDLPVSSMSYEVGNSGLTNAAGIKGGPLLSPEIDEHVFFRGTDLRPVGTEVDETFVRRAGHWLLAADSTDTSQTSGDSARPWAGPRISVAKQGPLIVVTDATQPGGAAQLAGTVNTAISFDADVLDVPADDHILVDATTTGSVMKFDNNESAAAVTFGVDASKDFRSTGLAGYRIKVNPKDIASLSKDPLLLRHELTHYLMYKYTEVNPKWLTEGLADYVAFRPYGLPYVYLSDSTYNRLMARPHDLTVSGLFGQDPQTDYPLAMACVTYLIDHGGMTKLKLLMRTYASYPFEVFQDTHTRDALQKVYGLGPYQVAQGAFALLDVLR